jgi:hypothetical protein
MDTPEDYIEQLKAHNATREERIKALEAALERYHRSFQALNSENDFLVGRLMAYEAHEEDEETKN